MWKTFFPPPSLLVAFFSLLRILSCVPLLHFSSCERQWRVIHTLANPYSTHKSAHIQSVGFIISQQRRQLSTQSQNAFQRRRAFNQKKFSSPCDDVDATLSHSSLTLTLFHFDFCRLFPSPHANAFYSIFQLKCTRLRRVNGHFFRTQDTSLTFFKKRPENSGRSKRVRRISLLFLF